VSASVATCWRKLESVPCPAGANLNVTREKGTTFNVVAAAQANTNQSAPVAYCCS